MNKIPIVIYSGSLSELKSGDSIAISGSSVHNDLSGIQGGAVGDYQHLTTSEVTNFDNTYISFVDKHRNGFLLSDTNTVGDISFVEATRIFTIQPKSGQPSFDFYSDSVKYKKTSSENITITNTTVMHFVYYDGSGNIQETTTFVDDLILKYALVALIYWNTDYGYCVLFANERHGADMGGITHLALHNTVGARYSSGLNITGLVDASKTFTGTTSGVIYDEDIEHIIPTLSTLPFLYKDGANGYWVKTAADNYVGYNSGSGYYMWNENTSGTNWQLTRSTSSTDYIPYHVVVTNDKNYPVVKIIGQSAYPNRSSARNAIEDEIRKISLDGLTTPEFVFLFSYIVRRNGDLENLSDGSTYVDFRYIYGAGTGGTSVGITSHNDLTDLDSDDHTQYDLKEGRTGEYITLDLADSISNGTTSFANSGAGFQQSFSATADNELLWDVLLPDGYTGKSFKINIGGQLYNTAPTTGDKIVIEVDYFFGIGDGTEDMYSLVDGNISETIDVSGWTANRTNPILLSTVLTGKTDAKVVLITLRRKGTDANDTYSNTWDIFGAQLIYQ